MLSRNDIKNLARLQQKKYRLAEQKFIIEGLRLVIEALRSDWPIELLLMTHDFSERPPAPAIIAKARQKQIPVYQVPKMEFKKITDTVHSQGVLAILRMKQWEDTPISLFQKLRRCLFVAIEKLQDPGNLGTIIRTAEWLGADAAVLGPECVEWSNPKALRASMG
ncbi:MAG: RNA methyltransferase, partial [Calditrichaeota bacterium]